MNLHVKMSTESKEEIKEQVLSEHEDGEEEETDSEYEADPNELLNTQLVAITGENRVSKKRRIMKEPIVNQDDIDDMEALAQGDPRGALGVKDGFRLEIKWKIEYEDPTPHFEYKWYPAVVTKAQTGETHRFHDEDNEEEYVDTPTVVIKSEDDAEEGQYVFISPHEIYSRAHDCLLLWRNEGDDWDMEVDEGEDDDDGELGSSIDLTSGNIGEQVDRIVSSMMVDVLGKYTERFNQFSQVTQVDFGRETLQFKDVLNRRITEWFEKKSKEFEEKELVCLSTVTLKKNDIEEIVQDVLTELKEKIN